MVLVQVPGELVAPAARSGRPMRGNCSCIATPGIFQIRRGGGLRLGIASFPNVAFNDLCNELFVDGVNDCDRVVLLIDNLLLDFGLFNKIGIIMGSLGPLVVARLLDGSWHCIYTIYGHPTLYINIIQIRSRQYLDNI
jgi:hypothetical protein